MFILDEMKTVIKDSIDEAIGSQQFNHDKVRSEANRSDVLLMNLGSEEGEVVIMGRGSAGDALDQRRVGELHQAVGCAQQAFQVCW
jgi:hypothetical protein